MKIARGPKPGSNMKISLFSGPNNGRVMGLHSVKPVKILSNTSNNVSLFVSSKGFFLH